MSDVLPRRHPDMRVIVDGKERHFTSYLALQAFLLKERAEGRRALVTWVSGGRYS